MVIYKKAEARFTPQEIHAPESALADSLVRDRFFRKVADLRKVAPKAGDFLYFSAVMMHGAEAALIDQATGEPRLGTDGKPLTAEWVVDQRSGSWKWKCSDPSVKPYKNNNGDIFPEQELKKAYKLWVEKPLCKDHQSSSVDGVRGLVIDTYWDDKRKRVIALCALDKVNYPDLARKVATGYATNVSMGTAVGKSICFDCGNVAQTENDYCKCVRARSAYGEINVDLSPIELSLVVTGADPGARLRSVIASLDTYSRQKEQQVEEMKAAGCAAPGEVDRLENEVRELRRQVALAGANIRTARVDSQAVRNLLEVIDSPNSSAQAKELANAQLLELLGAGASPGELASMETPAAAPQQQAAHDKAIEIQPPYGIAGNLAMTGGRGRSYTEDPQSSGPVPHWSLDGRESRLAGKDLGAQLQAVAERLENMESTLKKLSEGIRVDASRTHKEEQTMSKLRERARARRAIFEKKAYHQGGGGPNEPQTYPVDPLNDQLKTKGDKQMEGQGMEPGNDGLHPGYQSYGNELALKKKLSRAELEERRLRREAILSSGQEKMLVDPNTKKVYHMDPTGKVTELQQASAEDFGLDGDVLDPESPLTSEAYFQGGGGVNEPQTYPVDPLNDQLKTKGDKQMEGQGMEPGNDGLHPGYQSYGNELALKKKWLRASLRARFLERYADEDKKEINKAASRWVFSADGQDLFSASAEQIFGEDVERHWDVFASEEWGRRALAHLRDEGLEKTSYLLTGKAVKLAAPPMPAPGGADMPPAMPPAGGPEEGPEEEAGAEPTKGKVDELLAKIEKDLGDLKDALQEGGEAEGGKEELPPVAEAAADDGELRDQFSAVVAGLDDSADELALLSDVLERKIEAGLAGSDETKELVRIANESMEAATQLRAEAALVLEAAKKDKKDEDEKEEKDEKKGGKKKELPPFMKAKKDKAEKEEKEEKGGKKGKKEEKGEEEEEEENGKEEKENGKKEASDSELLDRLISARAARRRKMVRVAIGLEADDDMSSDVEKLKYDVGGLKGLESEEHDIDLDAADAEDDGMSDLDYGAEDDMSYADEGDMTYYDDDDALIAELLGEIEGGEGGGEEAADGMLADDAADDAAADDAADGLVSDAAKRRAWRERVAAELEKAAAGDYQLKLDPATDMDTDMVPKAHPGGGTQLGGLDTQPSDEGAKVESIEEVKAKIMKAVESLPPVREAVARIGDLLKAGALKESDLSDEEKLRALAVDPEAAKYWTQYFSQADSESAQFGRELTQEFVQKKAASDVENYKVKLGRAYDLALEMRDGGLLEDHNLQRQVDDLMAFDDNAFDSFKKTVARLLQERGLQVRTASAGGSPALQVGMQTEVGGGGHAAVAEGGSLASQLGLIWG